MNEAYIGIFFLVFVIVYVLLIGLVVADYITKALGLYRLAKQSAVSNPWLAWLPIGHGWTLGVLCDAFEREKGLNRKWRIAFLVIELLAIGLFVVFYVSLIIMMIVMMAVGAEEPTGGMIVFFCVAYIGILAFMLAAVALQVLNIVCLYQVYDKTYPEKTMKYLLLSFLVPLAQGICLLRAGAHYQEMMTPEAPADVLLPIAEGEAPQETDTPDENETV